MHYIGRPKVGSKNCCNFTGVWGRNDISGYLPQGRCDVKKAVISIGDKVTGAANITVVCCSYSHLKEMLHFS